MTDEANRQTRRHFLQQSALTAALAGGAYCISQKTDALAKDPPSAFAKDITDEGMPYPYFEPEGEGGG